MYVSLTDRINDTKGRIEARLIENKSSVKSYASKDRAVAALEVLTKKLTAYWEVRSIQAEIIELDNGRFTPVVDLNDIIRSSPTGGFVGYALEGFFTISTDLSTLNNMSRAA